MASDNPLDWLSASVQDRRALYAAIKILVDLRHLGWNDFYSNALGYAPTADYHDNFRRGINSRKDCARMYGFLRQHFPDAAAALHRNAECRAYPDDLHRIVHRQGKQALAIVVAEHGNPPRYREPPGYRIVHHGEPFFLQLDAPISGSAICLRGLQDYWFPQPLGARKVVEVNPGRQWITLAEDGITPAALTVREDRLIETYAIIVGADAAVNALSAAWSPEFPLHDRQMTDLAGMIEKHPSAWFLAWGVLFYLEP